MKFGYWIPSIALALLIYIFSGMEKPPEPDVGVEFGDKFLHFIAYGFLSGFIALALNKGKKVKMPNSKAILAFVIASVYGISDEFHQSFVNGRDADVFDWVADTIGAIVGSYVFMYISSISLQEERKKIRNTAKKDV